MENSFVLTTWHRKVSACSPVNTEQKSLEKSSPEDVKEEIKQ